MHCEIFMNHGAISRSTQQTRAAASFNVAMPFDKSAIESSIPDLFATRVRRHGERLAIVTEGGRITYRELDQLANCIAGSLVGNGHRHGQTVAILVDQGILQIAAILGILKAGGIYVPLDPALGRRRLHEIIQHADSQLVLADWLNQSTARLISGWQRRVLNIPQTADP